MYKLWRAVPFVVKLVVFLLFLTRVSPIIGVVFLVCSAAARVPLWTWIFVAGLAYGAKIAFSA